MAAQKVNKVFERQELKVFSRLTSPAKIQAFLDEIPYSDEACYRCPRSVLRDRKAHCYDGAVFAAAALKMMGEPPLLVEILPGDRDDDHILAVFRRGKTWGAIAKSNFVGLRYREPVYRDLRELVMSYFESYYNVAGERTLRGYTDVLNLDKLQLPHWAIEDEAMDVIGDALDDIRKYKVISPAMARKLTRIDERSYRAGLQGADPAGLFQPTAITKA